MPFRAAQHPHDPSRTEIDVAAQVLAAVPFETLYARIDLVRLASGDLAVMECEMIEPYLYPLFDPSGGEIFAREVLKWFERAEVQALN